MEEQFIKLRGHTFIDRFDEDSVIVDLGANEGEFSKQVADSYPFGKIILVEGNPRLIAKIKESLSSHENINVLHKVVGPDSRKKVKFYISDCYKAEASSVDRSLRDKFGVDKTLPEVEVEMITLLDIFEMFELDKIDLLKMDIEGVEWDLFESLPDEVFERVEQISIEFHDFTDKKLLARTEQVIGRLTKLGYKFVHCSTEYMEGSPYKDCLFYK